MLKKLVVKQKVLIAFLVVAKTNRFKSVLTKHDSNFHLARLNKIQEGIYCIYIFLKVFFIDFLPSDLKKVYEENGVDGCVAVQADQTLDETDFLLSLANENDFKNRIDDFALSVQSQDLTIERNIEPKEVVLRIDTFLFTTALFNILENAVKYGKESVKIKIDTRLTNNHYEIEISDNGIGISEQDQKVVFDKFYRVGSGNIHNVKGLGLGLYYTKQVIDAHEGSIQVKSEANKGTTFMITIPVS